MVLSSFDTTSRWCDISLPPFIKLVSYVFSSIHFPETASNGAARIFPDPPLSGVSYFIEMGEPSAQVPFNVNWRWSPTIWNVSVSEVTLEDSAGFSFQVPTKGLLWASRGLGAIAAIM